MFDPGERWQYGTSIDWVGRIVESVSGEPLETYFRKHIFEPLGMKDTGLRDLGRSSGARSERPRRQPDGSLKPEPMEPAQAAAAPRTFSGGGGIYSTAPDYLTLLRMLHARRRARWRAHPAARDGRAHGSESDRRGSKPAS